MHSPFESEAGYQTLHRIAKRRSDVIATHAISRFDGRPVLQRRGNPSFGLAEAASKAEGPHGTSGFETPPLRQLIFDLRKFRGDRTVTVAASKTAIAGSIPAIPAKSQRASG